MGSSEEKQSSTARLLLFSARTMQSPERSGTLTPPLQTSASVPFRWEKEPGKPIPCTALVPFSDPKDFLPKCLELPPRLLVPSPTTVLDGPYVGSNRFKSPSFRMSSECYGSFGAERGVLGAMVLSKGTPAGVKKNKRGGGWWFGSWRKKAFKVKREVTGGSHVFPSSSSSSSSSSAAAASIGETPHSKVSMPKMKRVGSFSEKSHGKSRLWTTIREGLKQMVPRRSEKLKQDESAL